MSKVETPSGLELALNTLWLPDTAVPRPQPNEPEPQRPNRSQRRAMKKALKRKGRGYTR